MDNEKYLGRMAAMVSHDLCNVLATIQQASGLMGDFLYLARKESLKSMGLRPKFKYHDKFQEIIAQVQAQVDRGQGICERLSALGHSTDDGPETADVGVAAALVGSLCGRAAKKHKASLEVACAPEPLKAAARLIDVLTALDTVVQAVLPHCGGEPRALRLAPGRGEGEVFIDVVCAGMAAQGQEALAGALPAGKPGIFTIGIVQGGVRLAFAEAGR
ncbi:hypothetical protein [Fundidesulfovibrio agrisoli]|uniref:hypothetical protein n=1 Tax=Fundidesulfovibrio agrisoli TaxID=2922717 RepID=UPI001FAE4F69|nr:hypothetical protein [Fundidesulfovibrio agrisoli]